MQESFAPSAHCQASLPHPPLVMKRIYTTWGAEANQSRGQYVWLAATHKDQTVMKKLTSTVANLGFKELMMSYKYSGTRPLPRKCFT